MSDKRTRTPMTRSRRWFLLTGGTAGSIALAGCLGDDDDVDDTVEDDDAVDEDDTAAADDETDDTDDTEIDDEDEDDEVDEDEDNEEETPATYEVWAADQNLNVIYVYEGAEGSDEFELVGEIDVGADGGERPHMIHFSSDYSQAAVANASQVFVYDTADHSLVGSVETGAGTHFAGFDPGDEFIVVDVIGDNKILQIDATDLSIQHEIVPSDAVEEIGETQNPVCHSYDANGRSIHTLGPGYGDAGVVIVDHDGFEIVNSWPGEAVSANCGTFPNPARDDQFFLTGGLPSNPDEDVDGVGELYVLDPTTDEVADEVIDTGGIDTHGLWVTDGGDRLWVLNRETNDGVVYDTDDLSVVDTIDQYGPDEDDSPDIMWPSPDGEYMFVTLRGPEPRTGSPHAATGVTPGVAVISQETRDLVTVLEPDPIADYGEDEIADEDVPTPDFHAVGVVPGPDFDVSDTSPPYFGD